MGREPIATNYRPGGRLGATLRTGHDQQSLEGRQPALGAKPALAHDSSSAAILAVLACPVLALFVLLAMPTRYYEAGSMFQRALFVRSKAS